MKTTLFKSLLLVFFFSAITTAYSQELKIGNNYFFTVDQISENTENINVDGVRIDRQTPIKAGHQIKILDVKEKTVYFKYLNFRALKNPNSLEKGLTDFQAIYNVSKSTDQTKVFSMPKDDFEKFTQVLYNRFRGFKYGGYTVPIRLRKNGNSFEFNSNVSLGANVIARFGLRKKEHAFIDLSFGVSITKVDLNESNSDLGSIGTEFEDIKSLSPAAFTYTIGALLNLAENVNLGVYWGWDRLQSADNKADWIYNKKPWLGIGLNISAGKASNSGGRTSQSGN